MVAKNYEVIKIDTLVLLSIFRDAKELNNSNILHHGYDPEKDALSDSVMIGPPPSSRGTSSDDEHIEVPTGLRVLPNVQQH